MKALVTAGRVLNQLRHDPRTIALIMVVPNVFMALLWWLYSEQDTDAVFNSIAPSMLGIFPLILMFVVTSISTLRERKSGTLERLLTMSLSKGSFMGGYALAFGVLAAIQAVLTVLVSVYLLGTEVESSLWALIGVAVLNGVLGASLGLLASGFAQSEFQAVQFLPAFVLPQLLVCGLLMPRDQMPEVLEWFSDFLPMTYAVDAMKEITSNSSPEVGTDVLVLALFIVISLVGASVTLRRRTD